ncbi:MULTISPECIES: GNAT family N-acetyltransferase [Metabacillus]|uniref:GNAT family acetyltransferase n=2 Tax=Metabacillus TaxID=2675233 RepID=A0A179SVH5_9BACI|nr:MULTISPECIES: GNAT family N-acetyltransferase [Metabacillus]OAS85384.1 GNAT family acetyltransferase [Metabacillus litoralis]QNF29912.1 GNAT family N-acetyltransferase [Metabacillus sp. KUDC1714]
MEIKLANVSDAGIIHELMIKAFMEYKDEVPPSSALDETVDSISTSLKNNEMALITYIDKKPVGMVRFKLKEDGLYFFRLSVIPEKQGQGIAKKIVKSLEEYAKHKEVPKLLCKVRMTVPKNINLYSSIGFSIYNEEIVHKSEGINIKVVSMLKHIGEKPCESSL